MTEESKEFIINKRCIGASGVVLWGGCIHGHGDGEGMCIKCATEEALKTLNSIMEEVKQLRLIGENDEKYARYDKVEALVEELKTYTHAVYQTIFNWEGTVNNIATLANVILQTVGVKGVGKK
jgi:hypothetical protein